MKYLYATLLACSFTSSYSQSQWHQLFFSNARVEDISFLDDARIAICTSGGHVLHSENGGYGWDTIFYAIDTISRFRDNYYLRSIQYVNESTIITGSIDSAFSFITLNKGQTWHHLNIPSHINGICGMDMIDNRIIGVGSVNGQAHTITSWDKGITWQYRDLSNLASHLIDVYFVSSDTGYACGSYTPTATNMFRPVILKTTNGGVTWFVDYAEPDTNIVGYSWKLFPESDDVLYASVQKFSTEPPVYYKYTKGSPSWVKVSINAERYYIGIQGIGFLNDTLGWFGLHTSGWYRIDFANDTIEQILGFPFAMINRFHKLNDSIIYGAGSGVYAYFDSTTTTLSVPKLTRAYQPESRIEIHVIHNPIQNGELKFEIDFPSVTQTHIGLFNMSGVLVHEFHRGYVAPGMETYHFRMDHLPAGQYVLFQNSYEGSESVIITYVK